MRTLVISDLHLGSRLGRDVLRRPAARDALLDALDDIDRLVLLGDAVELAEGRAEQALRTAEPVLRALGARMGPRREVVLLPGNHDHALVDRWLRAHPDRPAAVDDEVPRDATPTLARLTSWLEPAQIRVHYPGVYLADGVWATHGHHLDRHLVPGSAWGITRGWLGRPPADTATPRDYERARRRRPSSARITRWLPRPVAALADDVAELLRASTAPSLPRRLRGHQISPATALVLGWQMQRASVPAMARVAQRLEVDAAHVIFGHVHRLGPLEDDDPKRWTGPGAGPRLVNTGSWVYEPLLLHRATPPHPYWPGGAVIVQDGAAPQAVSLLDHLTDLSPAPAPRSGAAARPRRRAGR